MLATVLQTSVLSDLQGPYGVEAASVFRFPIMQAEFARCHTIGGHKILNSRQAPLEYLAEFTNVHPIGYFLPACTPTHTQLGDETAGPTADPYWLRRHYRMMAEQHDWYLRGSNDRPLVWSAYKQPVVDLSKPGVQQWIVGQLLSHPVEWIMLDTMFTRFEAYIPGLTDVQNGKLIEGYKAIAHHLQQEGKKVLGNGAWEMVGHDHGPDEWYFLYEHDVDMVMVEWPTGFIDNHHWWPLTEDRFQDLCELLAHKHISVMLYAKYVAQPGHYNSSKFGNREDHDKHYGNLAHHNQAVIALGENTNRTWYESYMEAWRGPVTDPTPIPTPHVPNLIDRVTALESQMDRLTNCLSNMP